MSIQHKSHVSLLLASAFLAACSTDKPADATGTVDGIDAEVDDQDGDGHDASTDCDDSDAAVFPGAPELCNGFDDDCDGDVDEDPTDASTWYADADGDGYVVLADIVEACEAPDGWADDSLGEDCNDSDPDMHPGAPEVCNDLDDDCDSEVDEGVLGVYWADVDDDGYGGDATVEACEAPSGYLTTGGEDCDDTNPAVNPGAVEVCHNGIDDDCDGVAPGCELTGSLQGSDAAFSLLGESGSDYDGQFAAAGDFNGDGVADIVSAAPYSDALAFNSGHNHVVYGPLAGAVAGADADLSYTGEADRQYMGWDLIAGDLDGDGFDDVAHGATGAGDYGRVYVQYGSPSGLSDLSGAGATFDGSSYDDALGRGITMGDLDGSGAPELLFAASAIQTVYVFTGAVSGATDLSAAHATLHAPDADLLYGRGIDARGDLNGDGLADVALTAGWADDYAGLAYVSYGPLSGAVSTEDGGGRIEGSDAVDVDLVGSDACSTGGDVNGDGYDDLLLGAYGDGEGGTARLFLGPVSGTLQHDDFHARLDAPAAGTYTGNDLELIGDVDADGHSELLIASHESVAQDGVALVYGPVTGTLDLYTVAGSRFAVQTYQPYRGMAHYAGDLNGDGHAEVLWADTSADSSAGGLYLHWGGGF